MILNYKKNKKELDAWDILGYKFINLTIRKRKT